MNKHRGMSTQWAAASAVAGAVLGATSTAQAGLQVFDHRAAPFHTYVDYWTWDQTIMLMDVKTGDFQYVVASDTWDPASLMRYDQDGFVGNSPIPETDKTNDTVWFSHRDMIPPGKSAAADGVALETFSGGVAGTTDPDGGTVYDPGRVAGSNPNTWSPHDWYWADQDGTPLPLPLDGSSAGSVDGSLNYTDGSSTGYTGAVSHGFGGLGHGSGSAFGHRHFSIGFKIEEADGTHYGWVALDPGIDLDRNGIRSVFGWAYQTTPGVAAALTWDADPDGVLGDFDGDDDVDADDIDILCANMGGDVATYDMDGDLDVDEDDMIYHIENLVELQDGSGRVGTMRGDFNLDGFVNATDLAIMKPNFGLSGMLYSDGNANCDTVINGTDLAVLSANIGFAAPTGAIPEPATLSVLALGAAGILRRRSR